MLTTEEGLCTMTGTLGEENLGIVSMTLSNFTINDNTAVNSAGAIYNDGDSGTVTLTMTSCAFNGNSSDSAGAIYNDGDYGQPMLSLSNCTFNNNSAVSAGGALYNTFDNGNVALNIESCIFINNSTTGSGGALYNDSQTITTTVQCSRFVGNTASSGSALYENSGFINAIDNWWGSNSNPSALFGGSDITYTPWIIMSVQASPSNLLPGILSIITADFTQDSSGDNIGSCMPNGSPITFSAANGTVVPTTAETANGLAITLLSLNSTGSICAWDADVLDIIDSEQCITVTYRPLGLYRPNWGCICSDTGTQHVLISSNNGTTTNSLSGWVFDSATNTVSSINQLIFTPDILYNVAVYNTEASSILPF